MLVFFLYIFSNLLYIPFLFLSSCSQISSLLLFSHSLEFCLSFLQLISFLFLYFNPSTSALIDILFPRSALVFLFPFFFTIYLFLFICFSFIFYYLVYKLFSFHSMFILLYCISSLRVSDLN